MILHPQILKQVTFMLYNQNTLIITKEFNFATIVLFTYSCILKYSTYSKSFYILFFTSHIIIYNIHHNFLFPFITQVSLAVTFFFDPGANRRQCINLVVISSQPSLMQRALFCLFFCVSWQIS